MIAAVAVAVFFFACGSGQGTGEAWGPKRPAPHRSAEAGMVVVTQAPPHSVAQPAARPAPSSTPAPAPAPGAATRPGEATTFGSDEETEADTGDAGADDDQPSRPPSPAYDRSGHRVYSNKDLAKYKRVKEQFGMRDDVVVVDLSRKAETETEKTDKPAGLTAAERDAEIEATRRKYNDLASELDYEKKRVLPIENPFVPSPPVSDADKLAEAGMNNKERLERVKQRIAQIENDMSSLQHRLADLYNMKPSDAGTQTKDE